MTRRTGPVRARRGGIFILGLTVGAACGSAWGPEARAVEQAAANSSAVIERIPDDEKTLAPVEADGAASPGVDVDAPATPGPDTVPGGDVRAGADTSPAPATDADTDTDADAHADTEAPDATIATDDASVAVAAPAPPVRSEGLPLGPAPTMADDDPADAEADAVPWWKRTLPEGSLEGGRVAAALSIVVALIVALRWMLGRAGGARAGRPAGVLEVLARYPVARGQSLVLLKLARRVVLVHQANGTMSTLSEITAPDEVAALLARMEAGARTKDAARFASVLHGFEKEHEHEARAAAASARSGSGGRPSRAPTASAGGDAAVSMPPRTGADEIEVIDLTRSQGRGLGALLGKRRTR